ncbi:MAG TPA: phage portal protein [Umezawaea sp.]|nr:phage portal protein [Umezawaea sp.]
MPLPVEGVNHQTQWPPRQLDAVFDTIDVWDAWYSGGSDKLADVYGGSTGGGFDSVSRTRLRNRPAQYSGGVRGRLARWFWGAPTPLGEPSTKFHVPLASDIAAKSAKLLFAEPPTFTVGNSGTQDVLNDIVEESLHAKLLEAAEVCAGLGGVYLRQVWDTTISDRPWLQAVHADAGVPEWRAGRLKAVTFWRIIEETDSQVWRHLERHESGRILHGLYEGTQSHLGTKVPLAEMEATADLVESLDDGDWIETGVDKLTAGYIPNIRPNRLWRKNPAAADLGRADISGSEEVLDKIDETWTAWMRDIRIAKGRVFVASTYLQNNGPGQGGYFDADREIYAALNMLPQAGNNAPITVSQFAIRVEEHSRTARELTTEVLRTCGYSQQTFGLTGDVAATATEVTARERDSFLTRSHKILYWKPELADQVETLLAVYKAKLGGKVEVERPKVEFPDGVATDPEQQARTIQLLDAAGALSTKTKVEMLHPDWEKQQVDEEVELIQGAALEDPGAFTGGGPINIQGPQPPADTPPGEEPPP